jgi:hypothetical protein
MKNLILILAFIFSPVFLFAQYAQVTATITGSNGVLYQNGTYNISLVSSTGQDISTSIVYVGSIPITMEPVAGNLDATGSLNVQLLENSAFTAPASPNPAGTQYNFSICSQSPIGNTGAPPQRCFSGIFSVTFTPLSLTSQLSALAPPVGSTTFCAACIMSNPSIGQTITQPINTNFNFIVSGTGQVEINGVPIGTGGGGGGANSLVLVDTVSSILYGVFVSGGQLRITALGTTGTPTAVNGIFNGPDYFAIQVTNGSLHLTSESNSYPSEPKYALVDTGTGVVYNLTCTTGGAFQIAQN